MTPSRLVLSVQIFAMVALLHCEDARHGARAQNSIKPRKTKSKGKYRDLDESSLRHSSLCPELLPNRDISDCLHPCKSSEDCGNNGQICCRTLVGSDCKAECKKPVYPSVEEPSKDGTNFQCLDLETGASYKLGEFFKGKNGKCCKCTMKREIDCLDQSCSMLESQQDCSYNNTHYKEGQFVKKKDSCNNCSCTNGSVICTSHVCSPIEKCYYRGQHFREGYGLYVNECKHCRCMKGQWICEEISCTVGLASRQTDSATKSESSFQMLSVLVSLVYLCWAPG